MRALDFCLSITLGVWLAMIYFGALWLTFKFLSRAANPSVLLIASFLGRVGGVLYCFHLTGQDGRWDRFIACVAGFFLMRALLMRLLDPRAVNCEIAKKELSGRGPQ